MTKEKLSKLSVMFFSMGVGILLYILVHEVGHLIVMLSAGAKITDFSILTAHVSSTGGNYSYGAALWLHANGAVLPLFICFWAMLFYKRSNTGCFYRLFHFMLALMPIGSSLAWIAIPFLYSDGKAPSADDVTKFLNLWTNRGHSPYTVAAAAAAVFAGGIFIAFQVGIIRGYFDELRQLRAGGAEKRAGRVSAGRRARGDRKV